MFNDTCLNSRLFSQLEDILKFKRIDGVPQALQTIAGQCFADGKQTTIFRDRLTEISVPILVLWGAKDQIVSPRHAHDLPDSVKVELFADRAHMLPMEAATQVNRAIGQFVQ